MRPYLQLILPACHFIKPANIESSVTKTFESFSGMGFTNQRANIDVVNFAAEGSTVFALARSARCWLGQRFRGPSRKPGGHRRKLFKRKDWPPGRAGMRQYLQHIRLIANNCRAFNEGDPELCGQAGKLEAVAHQRMQDRRRSIRRHLAGIMHKLRERAAAAEADAAAGSE